MVRNPFCFYNGRMKSRASWGLVLGVIIAAGIASRIIRTGWIVFDKYLGDALYAMMVYVIVRMISQGGRAGRTATGAGGHWRSAAIAMGLMTAIELFQLTMIPARLFVSKYSLVRLGARLIGTEFSFLDLLAYAVGIGLIALTFE